MSASDRDRSIEYLLRRMSDDAAAPSSNCVDAEQIAAWVERSLRSEEASRVEEHLADCARCQAMLAVFAATAPAAPATIPLWRQWKVQWAAPLAAAAAAGVLWAVIPWTPREAAPSTSAAVAPPEVIVAPGPVVPGESPAEAPAESRAAGSAAGQPAPGAQASAAAPPPPAAAPMSPAPPPPAAPASPAPPAESATAQSDGELRVAAASPAPVPASGTAAQPRRFDVTAGVADASFPAKQPAQQYSGISRSGVAGTAAAEAAASAPAPPSPHARASGRLVVFRPVGPAAGAMGDAASSAVAPAIWWRIDAQGRVGRSLDAGLTWLPVPLDPGMEIVAGSAPSSAVCWLVAGNGAVLRSTDGVTFRPTTPPGAGPLVRLVGIEALSALAAVGIAADGRRWGTTDGGATWMAVP